MPRTFREKLFKKFPRFEKLTFSEKEAMILLHDSEINTIYGKLKSLKPIYCELIQQYPIKSKEIIELKNERDNDLDNFFNGQFINLMAMKMKIITICKADYYVCNSLYDLTTKDYFEMFEHTFIVTKLPKVIPDLKKLYQSYQQHATSNTSFLALEKKYFSTHNEFVYNFDCLKKRAKQIGVYLDDDFNYKPKKYCERSFTPSKPEMAIIKVLDFISQKHDFIYFYKFRLPFCRNKNPLEYDFFCVYFLHDRIIPFVIEVDGLQHHQQNNQYFGSFPDRHVCDILKQYYLCMMSIHFIRLDGKGEFLSIVQAIESFINQIYKGEDYVVVNPIKPIFEYFVDKKPHDGLVTFNKHIIDAWDNYRYPFLYRPLYSRAYITSGILMGDDVLSYFRNDLVDAEPIKLIAYDDDSTVLKSSTKRKDSSVRKSSTKNKHSSVRVSVPFLCHRPDGTSYFM
jgi:hypothetical protein